MHCSVSQADAHKEKGGRQGIPEWVVATLEPESGSSRARRGALLRMESEMRCTQCSTDNPEGAKFCGKCGARLERVCPKCGHHKDRLATGGTED